MTKDLKNKFDALVARMRTEKAKKAVEALFKATPRELAEAYKRGVTPRTSVTSPLRIDAIKLEYGDAAIGMTICPGKQGPSTYGGPWKRDLATDINVLRAWGCKIVLTAMEPGELEGCQVTNLRTVVEAAGLQWFHIPITDGDPPDERFDATWPVIGLRLIAMLNQGEKIVVHCRGGLGRTGMLVCLLLIELGTSPQEALGLVRAARPGTVETAAQEAFVLSYLPRLRA